jgi:cytoskeletal protein RodZ
MQPGPPQGFAPVGPPAYAQPQSASFGQPPESAVVLPKSRTGLVVVLVIAALAVLGGAVGVLFYYRGRAAAIAAASESAPTSTATASAATATATASSTQSSSAPPPASGSAAPTAAAETQDAAASGSEATGGDAAAAKADAAVGDAGAARENAVLSIVCVPDCETAKLDDKPLELGDAGVVSPEPMEVPPGPHTIAVGKASYMPQTKRVVLKAGQKVTETFHLFKAGPAAVPASKPCGKFLERCPN